MNIFDDQFYTGHLRDAVRSAERIVPCLVELFHPTSVLDVGCGSGAMLAEFGRHGVDDYLGVDGPYAANESLLIPRSHFLPGDVGRPLELGRRFDLVITTEVAEHLPPEQAAQFVTNLIRHGETVVLSASVPGQFGRCHLNEQWPSYWVRIFPDQGYQAWAGFRQAIWQDRDICLWYRQNSLIFTRPEASQRYPKLCELAASVRGAPLDVAHPDFMGLFRDTLRVDSSVPLLSRKLARLILVRLGLKKPLGRVKGTTIHA
jgi:SAM-dependent methyltransferase